jgi:hypothetical protein
MSLTSFREVGSGFPFDQIRKHYSERIQQAIEHASTPAERVQAQASAARFRHEWRKAIRLYEEYLAGHPRDLAVVLELLELYILVHDQPAYDKLRRLAWPLALKQPDVAAWIIRPHFPNDGREADEAMQLLHIWPDLYALQYQAHRALLWHGRNRDAANVLARMQGNAPEGDNNTLNLAMARQACAEGRRDDVEKMLRSTDPDRIDYWHLLELLGEEQATTAFLRRMEEKKADLVNFLGYPQFDPRPFPSLMRILEREQIKRPPPRPLPFACPPAAQGVD